MVDRPWKRHELTVSPGVMEEARPLREFLAGDK